MAMVRFAIDEQVSLLVSISANSDFFIADWGTSVYPIFDFLIW